MTRSHLKILKTVRFVLAIANQVNKDVNMKACEGKDFCTAQDPDFRISQVEQCYF